MVKEIDNRKQNLKILCYDKKIETLAQSDVS